MRQNVPYNKKKLSRLHEIKQLLVCCELCSNIKIHIKKLILTK